MAISCNFSRNKFLLFPESPMETERCLEVQWQPNFYGITLLCLKKVRCFFEISIFLAFRFLGGCQGTIFPVFHLPHQIMYCHNGIILLLSLSWLLKGKYIKLAFMILKKGLHYMSFQTILADAEYKYTPARSTLKAMTTDTCVLLAELEPQSSLLPPSRLD